MTDSVKTQSRNYRVVIGTENVETYTQRGGNSLDSCRPMPWAVYPREEAAALESELYGYENLSISAFLRQNPWAHHWGNLSWAGCEGKPDCSIWVEIQLEEQAVLDATCEESNREEAWEDPDWEYPEGCGYRIRYSEGEV